MTDVKLGQLVDDAAQRDAIHVAVVPVTADVRLFPGQDVGLIEGSTDRVSTAAATLHGVVDPFLKSPVQPGQRCWLMLYQNSVTGMRHHWEHPAFAEACPETRPYRGDVAASIEWMRGFADRIGLDYDTALEAGSGQCAVGYGHCFQGSDTPKECYLERDEYWKHYEIITGKVVGDEDRQQPPFSCSC